MIKRNYHIIVIFVFYAYAGIGTFCSTICLISNSLAGKQFIFTTQVPFRNLKMKFQICKITAIYAYFTFVLDNPMLEIFQQIGGTMETLFSFYTFFNLYDNIYIS